MNTLEIDTLLKKHPHSRPVFKGVYARNRLPRQLNVPSPLWEIRIQTIEWDITRLLENPVEAMTIVQKFVLLLLEHDE